MLWHLPTEKLSVILKMNAAATCGCRGIRRCGICAAEQTNRPVTKDASERGGWGRFGQSVDPDSVWMCPQCRKQFKSAAFIVECKDHNGLEEYANSNSFIDGLEIWPDFITEVEEASLIEFLDRQPSDSAANGEAIGWRPSQSGRRKQDFGPAPNFKQRKCKLRPGVEGLPKPLAFFLRRVSSTMTQWGRNGHQSPLIGDEFRVAEASSLDYTADASRASLDPHIDDEWLWGERIAGISLLSTAPMTFVRRDCTVLVALPRRALFGMRGPARHEWLHGIAGEHVLSRRVSITVREFSDGVRALTLQGESDCKQSAADESVVGIIATLDQWHGEMMVV